MALTFTKIWRQRVRDTSKKFKSIHEVTFDNNYPAGGWPVNPIDLGYLTNIYAFYVQDESAYYHLMVNQAAKKIRVLGAGPANGAFRAVASTAIVTNGAGNHVNVLVPLGTVDTDVMIAVIAWKANDIGAPASWTFVRNTFRGSNLSIYWKAASGEPASYDWTFSGLTAQAVAAILSYRNIDTITPIDAENSLENTSATSHLTPSVTTTMANDIVIAAYALGTTAAATLTLPAGMTSRYNAQEATNLALGAGADVAQAVAGATGQKTATSNVSADSVGQIITLRGSPGAELAAGSAVMNGKKSLLVAWGN